MRLDQAEPAEPVEQAGTMVERAFGVRRRRVEAIEQFHLEAQRAIPPA
jgi:hypothetical protein